MTTWLSHSPPRYTLKRTETICPRKTSQECPWQLFSMLTEKRGEKIHLLAEECTNICGLAMKWNIIEPWKRTEKDWFMLPCWWTWTHNAQGGEADRRPRFIWSYSWGKCRAANSQRWKYPKTNCSGSCVSLEDAKKWPVTNFKRGSCICK